MAFKEKNMPDQLAELSERVNVMEQRFAEVGYNTRRLVVSETNKRWKIQPQAETFFGMFSALCVDTIDPWKQNRVRFFSPLFTKPDMPIKSLDWCNPISVFGGFDDSGLNWVPPAGSTLCMIFENGSKLAPYYIGTAWHRNRGPDGNHNWGYNNSYVKKESQNPINNSSKTRCFKRITNCSLSLFLA